jgi:hypothetical protein
MQTQTVRLIDCSPARYYTRSVRICIVGVPASGTAKLASSLATALIDVPTFGASARSIACIDNTNGDARALGLIQDKALQLGKRPTVQIATLLFLSPYPSADPIQVFQRNPTFGTLSNVYYFLGNLVINISGETLLFASSSSEQTFRGFRTFFLKFASQLGIARPAPVNWGPGESLTVRSLSNRYQAQIDTKPVEHFSFFRIGHVNGLKQKPFFVAVNQIGFATEELEQLAVMLSADKRDFLPTIERPDIHKVCLQVPTQNARIVTDRSVKPKLAFDFAVKLVGINDLGVEAHDDLRRERKFVADSPVKKFVQRVLAELSRLPSKITQAVARAIGCLKRTQQGKSLFRRGLQLDLSGEFQASEYSSSIEDRQTTTNKLTAFLRHLKEAVSGLPSL